MRVEVGLQHVTTADDYKSSLLPTNRQKHWNLRHKLARAAALRQEQSKRRSTLRTTTILDRIVIDLRETAPVTPECDPAQPLPSSPERSNAPIDEP
jgi:hypothetical protein